MANAFSGIDVCFIPNLIISLCKLYHTSTIGNELEVFMPFI